MRVFIRAGGISGAGRGGTSTLSRMAVDQMPTANRSMHHCPRRRPQRHPPRCPCRRPEPSARGTHREEFERVRAAVEAVAADARVAWPLHTRRPRAALRNDQIV